MKVLFIVLLLGYSQSKRLPAKPRKIELWTDSQYFPLQVDDRVPQCDSKIYCQGRVLHTVQMASIFEDSKTFVDMKMIKGEEETLSSFDAFMQETDGLPTRPELKHWVMDNFLEEGSELEDWIPDDFNPNPKFLEKINDPTLKELGADVNRIWLELGRKIKDEVRENPSQYSIYPVPNPVIVPGGRFREFYYWDSYWVVRGLLYSEMYSTVKGILGNFRYMLKSLGHIPNGGRVYYNRRSQPPLLSGMIKAYVDFTNDKAYAIECLPDLLDEFSFFDTKHAVEVDGVTLYRYIDDSIGPRPESYREDFESGKDFETREDREEFYADMKAGAESGMDFTSRWFIAETGTNSGGLQDTKARSIIAVELSAHLYWNARIISEFYSYGNQTENSQAWLQKSNEIRDAMTKVLWSDEVGSWLDFDIVNNRLRDHFSASNLSPLWNRAFKPEDEQMITEKVLAYIEKNQLDSYPGGVPNTLEATGEQWDFPNVWAPMQYMLIMGLDGLNNDTAKELAFKWADKWVKNNFLAYKEFHAMFEKYHAVNPGEVAGGGEYEIQTGFGWSNGVLLELLDKYGDRLSSANYNDTGNENGSSQIYNKLPTTLLMTFIAWIFRSS